MFNPMKRIVITLVASAALVCATAYAFSAMAQDNTSTTTTTSTVTSTAPDSTTTTTGTHNNQMSYSSTTTITSASPQSTVAYRDNGTTSTYRENRYNNDEDPFFTFGLKAGVNYSELTYNSLSVANGNAFDLTSSDGRAWGLAAGGFFRVGRTIFLQPEIMLSQKGGRYMIGSTGGTVNSRQVDIKFTNVDLPLLVGVKLAKVFRINAGPVLTFRTSDNGNLGDTFDQYASDNNYFRKGLIGYQAGIGFDLGKLVLDLRYEGNVRDVIRIDFVNPNNQGQFLSKSNLFQATVGFKFL
jgi:hypothetical protein